MKILSSLRCSLFIASLPFGILMFALPIYGKQLGANAIEIGLFFSAFSLISVVLRFIIGPALDYYGRRKFLLVGLTAYAVTMLIIAFSVKGWHIILARACQGAASSLLWLSVYTITADVTDRDERGRSFGGIPEASYKGSIIGAFVGFTVLMSVGIKEAWRPLFLGFTVMCLLAGVLAFIQIPETKPTHAFETEEGSLPRSRPWILLLLITTVTGASWAMITPILMIFLQERLTSNVADLGGAYLPAACIWALLPSRLGGIADRFGRKPMMVMGLAGAAVGSFIIPHINSLLVLSVLWAFQALCFAAGDPAEAALVADLTGGDQRGRAYGVYTMADGLGATLGPLIGGGLYVAIGCKAPFYMNGVILAVNALLLLVLLEDPIRRKRYTC